MAVRNFKNFAVGTLGASLGSGATSGTLTTGVGAKMPAVPFDLVIWGAAFASPDLDSTAEIVTVTALTGDAIGTMVRAQEGTSTKAWASGDKVLATVTARALNTDAPRNLLSGIGTVGGTATVAGSVMPGAAALTIPANTLAVGDRLVIIANLVRRGTQKTVQINHESFWNGVSLFGGNLALAANDVGLRLTVDVMIAGTTSQSLFWYALRDTNANTGSLLSTADITTAITFDFKAWLAGAATDTYGLEHVLIQLNRAS